MSTHRNGSRGRRPTGSPAADMAAIEKMLASQSRLREAMSKVGIAVPDVSVETGDVDPASAEAVDQEVLEAKRQGQREALAVGVTRLADDLDAISEMTHEQRMALLPTLTAGDADIARTRANIVIAEWRDKGWKKDRDSAGKPCWAGWADFCKRGLGITAQTQITGDARAEIVAKLYAKGARLHAREEDMAAACGGNLRTIARVKAALGLVDKGKQEAALAAAKATQDAAKAELRAAGAVPVPAGATEVSVADMGAYFKANVEPAAFLRVVGPAYARKVAALLPPEYLRKLADAASAEQ